MLHPRSVVLACAAAILAMAASMVPARADDAADLIKSKGLAATGNLYVLPAEKELAEGIPAVLKLKAKVAEEDTQRDELERKIKICKSAIQQWDFQRRNLYEQYTKATDVVQKNNMVAEANVLDSKIKEADTVKTDLETKVNAMSMANREQYINTVLDLGAKADKAQADYKEFAADTAVKQALETINKTASIKMRLGPSTEFLGRCRFLNTMRTAVASDVIPIKAEGNVSTVEVTFNGTLTRSIVLDTGAALICLTADLAEQLKIVPGPTDPTLKMVLADGREVEGKLMILKSVRVGQFTAHDVECAVLPKTLIAAEPLLGGSFLKNFIVKIDPKAHELHLSAISDPSKKITTGGAPASAPAHKDIKAE